MKYKIILILLIVFFSVSSISFAANKELLDWEADKLNFESDFLSAKLNFPADKFDLFANKDIGLFSGNFEPFGKETWEQYQMEMLSIRAAYHCNRLGKSVGEVAKFIEKSQQITDKSVRATMVCIQDFYKNPDRFCPSQGKKCTSSTTYALYIFSKFDQDVLYSHIAGSKYTLTNPTLHFLNIWGKEYPNIEKFFIQQALYSEQEGKIERAIDIYARLMDIIKNDKDNQDFKTQQGFYLMNVNKNERDSLESVYSCSKELGVENPFSEIFKKTADKNNIIISTVYIPSETTFYAIKKTGMSCVDNKGTDKNKVEAYMRLTLGIRGDTFTKILRESNRDIKATKTNLERYSKLLNEVKTLEDRFKEGFSNYQEYFKNSYDSNGKKTPYTNLRKLTMFNQKIKKLSIQTDTIFRGVTRCTSGLIVGSLSPEGVGFVVAGVLAVPLEAGTAPAVLVGGIFLATGAYSTGEAAINLEEQWQELDTSGKSQGVCNVAISALMTAAGYKAVEYSPVKTTSTKINVWEVQGKPKTAGEPIKQQIEKLKDRGAKSIPEPVAERPLTALEQAVLHLSEEKRVVAENIGKTLEKRLGLKYENWNPEVKNIFDMLMEKYSTDGLDEAVYLWKDEINKRYLEIRQLREELVGKSATDQVAWQDQIEVYQREIALYEDFGGDVILGLFPNKPKSIKLFGKDNALVKSILRTDYSDMQNFVHSVNDILRNERVRGGRGFTLEEREFLLGLSEYVNKASVNKGGINAIFDDVYMKSSTLVDFAYDFQRKSGLTNSKRVYLARDGTLPYEIDYIRTMRAGKDVGKVHDVLSSRSTLSGKKGEGDSGSSASSIYYDASHDMYNFNYESVKFRDDAITHVRTDVAKSMFNKDPTVVQLTVDEIQQVDNYIAGLTPDEKYTLITEKYQKLFENEMSDTKSAFYKATSATYKNLVKDGVVTNTPKQEIIFIDTGSGNIPYHLQAVVKHFHPDAKVRSVVIYGFEELPHSSNGWDMVEIFSDAYLGLESGPIINPKTFEVDVKAKNTQDLMYVILNVMDREMARTQISTPP